MRTKNDDLLEGPFPVPTCVLLVTYVHMLHQIE